MAKKLPKIQKMVAKLQKLAATYCFTQKVAVNTFNIQPFCSLLPIVNLLVD